MTCSQSPRRRAAGHSLKNLALVFVSLCLLPLNTAIFVALDILNRLYMVFYGDNGTFRHPPPQSRKTVLITGLNMTKGLVLARLFHRAGHRVIGADTHHLAPGRVSRAVSKFYHLPSPDESLDVDDPYVQRLVEIVWNEDVDLWVSASDVNGAIPDAIAKEEIERETDAKAIQFNADEIRTLHEKDAFMKHTEEIGLTIPDTAIVQDRESIIAFLQERSGLEMKPNGAQYLVKPIGVDDLGRNDMPLLPLGSETETIRRIEAMPFPETEKPTYIIQEFISGAEYCTHALIVHGRVRTFVACPSSDMLMHYTGLPATTALHRAMLDFTQKQAESFGKSFTGHMSFDFLVKHSPASQEEGIDDDAEGDNQEKEEKLTLYPIECNPRVHTAIVLLKDTLDDIDAYLSILNPPKSNNHRPITSMNFIPTHPQQYYWIGHDLVELVLNNLYLTFVTGTMSPSQYYDSLRIFANHALNWQDGTFEMWDPWPCWWLLPYILAGPVRRVCVQGEVAEAERQYRKGLYGCLVGFRNVEAKHV